MLEFLIEALRQLHYQYFEQFLAALVPMTLTVVIHGQGMTLAGRYLKHYARRLAGGSRTGPRVLGLIVIVAIMLLAHFFEVSAWAFFYFLTGMLENVKSAMLLSINAYTTLGASNISLPGRWAGLDGFEAMTAMLMFGWSTAVLAAIVQKIHSIDI